MPLINWAEDIFILFLKNTILCFVFAGSHLRGTAPSPSEETHTCIIWKQSMLFAQDYCSDNSYENVIYQPAKSIGHLSKCFCLQVRHQFQIQVPKAGLRLAIFNHCTAATLVCHGKLGWVGRSFRTMGRCEPLIGGTVCLDNGQKTIGWKSLP